MDNFPEIIKEEVCVAVMTSDDEHLVNKVKKLMKLNQRLAEPEIIPVVYGFGNGFDIVVEV